MEKEKDTTYVASDDSTYKIYGTKGYDIWERLV